MNNVFLGVPQRKRQMEIYQWILRGMGFEVQDVGYFVYVNALKTPERFDGRLSFDIQLLSYPGNAGWVEKAVMKAKECLSSDSSPAAGEDCEFCSYRSLARDVE